MASIVQPQVSNSDMVSHSVNGTESTLIEYQWPTTKEGDFFFLQENVISFLGINAYILANAGKEAPVICSIFSSKSQGL